MTKKMTTIIIVLLTLGFILPKSVFGIGQMTKPIEVKSILRGQATESVLILYNSEEEEITYKLIAGGSISSWTSFYTMDNSDNSIGEIQVPAKSSIKAIARFAVPQDAPNGKYMGEVAIVSAPKETEGGKVSVSVGARVGRQVSIMVTDEEIIKLDTTIIPLKREVKKDNFLKIKIIHDNQGNVSVKPDIQLKITKSGKTVFNAIFPYPEDENPVRPLERKVMSSLIEWPTAGQNNGQYKAEVTVLLDGEVMKKSDFHFNVGFTVNRFLNYISRLGGGNLVLGWFIIGGFFIMLSMMLTFAGRKKGIWERLRRR